MNKKTRLVLFSCLLLALLSIAPLCTLFGDDYLSEVSIRASAATNSAEEAVINVSYSPVTGSYGSTETPRFREVFFSGETFYLNVHAGKDFYIKSCSIKVFDGSGSTYKTYRMNKTGYGAYWSQQLSGFPVGSYMCSIQLVYYLRSNQKEQSLNEEGLCPFIVTNVPTIKISPDPLKLSKKDTSGSFSLTLSTYWNLPFSDLGLSIGLEWHEGLFEIKEDSKKRDDENRVIYFLVKPLNTCTNEVVRFTIRNKNNSNNVLTTASFSVTIEDADYTVTYDYASNGGSSATKQQAEYSAGSSVSLSPKATKNGWTFVGWNTDKNATSKLSSYKMEAKDVTLYAIYKKTVTAKFVDYNGTTKRTNSESVTIYNSEKEATVTPPTQGTYTGWEPRGWSSDTTSNATPTDDFTVSANKTFYGLYERELYLSYDANGGKTAPSAAVGTQYMNSYRVSTKKNPSFKLAGAINRDGYDFKKWAKGGTDGTKYSPGNSVSISEDTTMYAIWDTVTHKVTYNFSYNGGSDASVSVVTVQQGDSVDLSPTAEKEDWIFLGWNTNKSAKTKLTSLKMKDADITLYAIFKKVLTATFVDYSGNNRRSTKKTQTIYNNTSIASVSPPSQGKYPGWTACGWNTDDFPNASPTSNFKISEDTTFYGLYKRTVTLSYDANGGDSTPDNVTETQYTNSYSITDTADPSVRLASAINKSGVSFIGWAKGSKTGELYQAGDSIVLTQNTNMYATFTNPKHTHSWGKPSWDWDKESAKATIRCETCSQQKIIQATVTKKVIRRALLDENGSIRYTATVKNDGKSYSSQKDKTIYRVRTIKLSDNSFIYDGSKKTPKVTVKDSKGNTLKNDVDYKVKYSKGRIRCGHYTAKVIFRGRYDGHKGLKFEIVPATVTGLKQNGGKGIHFSWNPVESATVYDVEYYDEREGRFLPLPSKKYPHGYTVTQAKGSLKRGTEMQVRVRAVYIAEDGERIAGKYSKTLNMVAV